MQQSSPHRVASILAAAAFAVFPMARPAQGLNIIINYNSGASVEPASDPTGAEMLALFSHVESYYEDIFEASGHTLTLSVWYEALGGSTLGVHTLTAQSGGRETAGNIRIDNATTWYRDPTPENHSEYNLSQTLWRNISAANRTAWFQNTTTFTLDTFEGGYSGSSNGSVPAAANMDMLSVIFHEVGHALGMSSANTSTQTETTDGDYDFDSVNIFGQTQAADVASGGNIAHLNGNNMLMFPSFSSGTRRLPSHSDLLSMARVHAYTQLDIPRREMYGGTNWNTAGNWTGNRVPGSADEAFIRNCTGIRTVSLSAAGFAGTLTVAEAMNLNTGAFLLSITNDAIFTGLDTDVTVATGGTLSANRVFVQDQAEFRPEGGRVTAGTLTVDNLAATIGFGTLSVSSRFNNTGTLTVAGGNLTLTTAGSGVWNLDGFNVGTLFASEGGVVNLNSGNLIVIGGLSDVFNGTMNIAATHNADLNTAWDLGGPGGTIIFSQRGNLNLNGGTTAATAASLNGLGTMTVGVGNVTVGTNNYGVINAPVVSEPGAHFIATGTLEINSLTTLGGGSFSGAGRVIQDGNVTVTGNTIVNTATYDWDGLVVSNTTVSNAVTLTINSEINDSYSGVLTVDGTLIVNDPTGWATDFGSTQLISGTIGGTSTVTFSATVNNASGTSEIDAPSRFVNAPVTVIAGTLSLVDADLLAGSSYTGAGVLSNGGVIDVLANTIIATTFFDMDGGGAAETNVAQGVTFTSNANNLESVVANDVFNGTLNLNGGTFAVNTDQNLWVLGAAGRVAMSQSGGINSGINGELMILAGGTLEGVSGVPVINAPLRLQTGTILVGTSTTMNILGSINSTISGTVTKQGAGTALFNSAQSYTVPTTLNVNSGTVQMGTDAGGGGRNLTMNLANGFARFNASQRLTTLNISGPTSTATMAPNGNRLLSVNSLSVTGANAAVDLTNNDMHIDYTGLSVFSAAEDLVRQGRNFGAWNGRGIRSSSAATDPQQITGLGTIEGSNYISANGTNFFTGLVIDNTSVVIKYTYNGDADLNGVVDFDDYARIDTGFLTGGDDWFEGDFDYSNTIDFDDYALIDQAFLLQGGPLDSILPSPEDLELEALAQMALQSAVASAPESDYPLPAYMGEGELDSFMQMIPEPGAASVLALAGLVLGRRRRA